VVSLCVLLIAAVIGGLPVYVRPQIDPLRHADAIVVLGGPPVARYPFSVELSKQSWAPMIFWSNPDRNAGITQYCAKHHRDLHLSCFVPDTPTTKGEARALRGLAAQYGWRTIIVMTFRPHISRARFILEKCFDGDLVMVESPGHITTSQWAIQYIYQTAGYVRAALQPGC
jgi:uncharacterized SAM-binding protein YcdF (DUF218 family)